MHGLIFMELQKFVTATAGADAWPTLLPAAGVPKQSYLATESYPDQELVAIVTAASTALEQPASAILEAFGEFLAPGLFKVYRAFIPKDWRTMDLLENTEGTIHKAVRIRDKKAQPPKLICTRLSPDQVRIVYTSPRRLCFVAKGLIRGVAKYYGEEVTVTESSCMHKGAAQCEILVKKER
jgi:hypothetical protein